MKPSRFVVHRFAQAAKAFGFTISLKKTEVMFQKPLHEAYTPSHIDIEGHHAQSSVTFHVSEKCHIKRRNHGQGCREPHRQSWQPLRTPPEASVAEPLPAPDDKIQGYRTAVLTTFLYDAETRVQYRKLVKLLQRFHQRCLRSIQSIDLVGLCH